MTEKWKLAEPWELNQGKRLVKRMKKLNVIAGREYPMLLEMLQTRFLAEKLDDYRGQGKGVDAALQLAMIDSTAREYPARTGHLGLDLYRLLVFVGANPGGVKRYLDNVIDLHFAGLGTGIPVDAPEVFVDHESNDRFPDTSNYRENY